MQMIRIACAGVSACLLLAARAEDRVFTVAAGQTLTVDDAIDAQNAGSDLLVKDGPGTLVLSGPVGATANFLRLDVRAGEVQIASGTDKFYPDIHICAGGTVRLAAAGALRTTTVVDVDAGGYMDFGGLSDTIDGFCGSGVVSNRAAASWSSDVVIKLKLVRGPHRFAGRAGGYGIFEVDQTSTNPNYALVVASADGMKDMRLRLGARASTNLLFAAGIGTFCLGQVQAPSPRVLYTADEEGKPVTVHSLQYGSCDPTKGQTMDFTASGPGSWYSRDGDTQAFKGSRFANLTGWLGSSGGKLIIGDHTAANALDPSTLSGIEVCSIYGTKQSLEIKHKDLPPTVFACPVIVRDQAPVTFWNDTTLEQPDIATGGSSSFTWYSNLTVKAGAVTGKKVFSGTGAKNLLTIAGGVFSGSPLTHAFSPLSYYSAASFGSQNLEMLVSGGEVVLGGKWDGKSLGTVPMKTTVTGGVLALDGQIVPPTGATAADPATLTVDGGTLAVRSFGGGCYVDKIADKHALVPEANNEKLLLRVGAKGMWIDIDFERFSNWDIYNQFAVAGSIASADGVTDGGIVRTGGGVLNFWYPTDIAGPFSQLDGKIFIRDVASAQVERSFFGTGSFTLGNAWFAFSPSAASSWTTRIATASGATFKLAGAGLVRMREGTAARETIEVGPLARDKGGILYLYDATTSGTTYNQENAGVFRVQGGLEAQTPDSPLLKFPVVTACYGSSNHHLLDFAKYDAVADTVTAFSPEDYGTQLEEGTVANLTGFVTVPADAVVSVKALRLASAGTWDQWDYSGKTLLTISAGAKVCVGNGTDPAVVILNNYKERASLGGAGQLDFGTSEGIFALNDYNNSGDKSGIVACSLAGSGGVTYTALSADNRNRNQVYEIRGTNTYTGGTIVNAATVAPYSEFAFSTGKVRLGDGESFGGRIRFGTYLPNGFTLPNDLAIAGWGSYHSATRSHGALYSETPGRVRLTGKAEIFRPVRVRADANCELEFAGAVSGDRLEIWQSAGKIVLSAPNVYTGGTDVVSFYEDVSNVKTLIYPATLALEGAGTAGSGPITLHEATLELSDATSMEVANDIRGQGTVKLTGRKLRRVSFKGDIAPSGGLKLDLCGRDRTVNSLKGFSEVGNSSAAPVTLTVLNADEEPFSGTVDKLVTLHYGPEVRKGLIITVW